MQLPTSYISSVGPAPAKFQAAADGLAKIDQAELLPAEVKNLRELECLGCCKVNYLDLEECLICLGCCKCCKVKYYVPSFHALSVMFKPFAKLEICHETLGKLVSGWCHG